jgi:pyrroloquinoline quinone (PQQ) biosynthesis protein C
MHTSLFLKVPYATGMTKDQVLTTPEIHEVRDFRTFMNEEWSTSAPPARAYGVFYLFETAGPDMHEKFYRGFQKSNLPDDALEYSRLHVEAERDHALRVKNGLGAYAADLSGLHSGIRKGSEALRGLWDGFQRHVFGP